MIQRIQTLFLALVAIFMSAFVLMSIWEMKSADGTRQIVLNSFMLNVLENGKVISSTPSFWLALAALAAIAISIFSIFSYKNRMLQIKLGFGISLLISIAVGLIVYYERMASDMIEKSAEGNFGPGLILPALALASNMLANKFIKRDEDMVRAADRMR